MKCTLLYGKEIIDKEATTRYIKKNYRKILVTIIMPVIPHFSNECSA
jgi:hypothetical protein